MFRSTPQQVLEKIARVEDAFNNWRMIPATNALRNRVFLALLSKALTVGRAICTLVEAGFCTEAFALSRTLIEIFFSVRYMSNKDTEGRATTFAEYSARHKQEWSGLTARYFPHQAFLLSRSAMKTAEEFKSKHRWTKHGEGAHFMALEPDAFETDESGQPITGEFDYDALYFETSQFVHATAPGLVGHVVESEQYFRVRASPSKEEVYGRLALINTVSYIVKIAVQVCRGIREEAPEAVQDMFKMLSES